MKAKHSSSNSPKPITETCGKPHNMRLPEKFSDTSKPSSLKKDENSFGNRSKPSCKNKTMF